MLSQLSISNFELIDHIDQTFYSGLNVITGETGTGKSMILSALNLIIGARGSDKVLKDTSKKCVLEASFKMSPSVIKILNDLGIEIENQLYIRREFSPQGRSRAFINDSPVNLEILRKLSSYIIDIHSQDQTNEINQQEYQLELLDIYCESNIVLSDYKELFNSYQSISSELNKRKEKAVKDKEEQDFIKFQYNELAEASLEEGEINKLEIEKELLSKQEEIKNALDIGCYTISEQEQNLVDQLFSLKQHFLPISDISPWLKELENRISELYSELKDLGFEIEAKKDSLDMSPQRLSEVEDRLHTYYSLESKFKVQGDIELIKMMDSYRSRLDAIGHIDDDIQELIVKQKEIVDNLLLKGGELSEMRKAKARVFGKEIESRLKQLGISHPSTLFKIKPLAEPSLSGLDEVQFLFSSNKDQEARAIDEVASGGERSRVMLVIKSIIGSKRGINSMVFDEIDTGISGEVAIKTGELLSEIGKSNQVISITHLPQVASKGAHHYKVDKKIIDNRTDVNMFKLEKDERINELAEMLGGKNISESARKIAKQLLKN